MNDTPARPNGLSRRAALGTAAKTVVASVAMQPLLQPAIASLASADVPKRTSARALNGIAGVDRVTVLSGKTYLRGWAGYGEPPRRRGRNAPSDTVAVETGPTPTVAWSKVSGPGAVTFADSKALVTTAKFSTIGEYVLKLTANNGSATKSKAIPPQANT